MWKGVTWIPTSFPLGLPGLLAGKTANAAGGAPVNRVEELVLETQESVARDMGGRSELWRQAAYQYLYGLGHRIPTDLPSELRRLAFKESKA